MKKFYQNMLELLKGGESFAVATIFDKSGSAPRSEGSKMIVRADGSTIGSIGGGRLEADVITSARENIPARKTIVQPFNLTSRDAAASDMICGGAGEILVDCIDAGDDNNLKVYSEVVETIAHGRKGWLITVLGKTTADGGVSIQQCLVKPDRTLVGKLTCDPYLLEKLIAGPQKITLHSEAFDEQRFLVEPLRQGGVLYIFGAGHVSQKIAPLSESVGFRTIVMDDRADYANKTRFPDPIETLVIDSFKKLPELEIGSDSYLVIVTRGHLFDRDVLEQVLRSGAAYIGMIGSRAKRNLVYAEIMSRGITKEELERVYSPIGTEIGAETPEELAVSIVGELIKVRSDMYCNGKQVKECDSTPCCEIRKE